MDARITVTNAPLVGADVAVIQVVFALRRHYEFTRGKKLAAQAPSARLVPM